MATENFGQESATGSDGQIGTNVFAIGPFSPAHDGSVVSFGIRAFCAFADTRLTMGLYADSSGSPGALLAHSVSVNQPSVSGLVTTLNINGSYTITAGTNYWIAGHAAADSQPKTQTGQTGKHIKYKADSTAQGSMVDPFPSSPNDLSGYTYTMFVTYTVASSSSSRRRRLLCGGFA